MKSFFVQETWERFILFIFLYRNFELNNDYVGVSQSKSQEKRSSTFPQSFGTKTEMSIVNDYPKIKNTAITGGSSHSFSDQFFHSQSAGWLRLL